MSPKYILIGSARLLPSFGAVVGATGPRITSYFENASSKAFFIMAFMIGGGIALRLSGIAPEQFIAVFYSGLGSSLFLAGILFWFNCQNYHTLLKAQQEKSNS